MEALSLNVAKFLRFTRAALPAAPAWRLACTHHMRRTGAPFVPHCENRLGRCRETGSRESRSFFKSAKQGKVAPPSPGQGRGRLSCYLEV
jgi:hypothetical protein